MTFVLQLLFLYPSTALMVKRLHDRNRPSYWAAFILVPMVLKSLTDLMGMTGDPLNQNALDYLLNIIVFVVVDLVLRRARLPARHRRHQPVRARSARCDCPYPAR